MLEPQSLVWNSETIRFLMDLMYKAGYHNGDETIIFKNSTGVHEIFRFKVWVEPSITDDATDIPLPPPINLDHELSEPPIYHNDTTNSSVGNIRDDRSHTPDSMDEDLEPLLNTEETESTATTLSTGSVTVTPPAVTQSNLGDVSNSIEKRTRDDIDDNSADESEDGSSSVQSQKRHKRQRIDKEKINFLTDVLKFYKQFERHITKVDTVLTGLETQPTRTSNLQQFTADNLTKIIWKSVQHGDKLEFLGRIIRCIYMMYLWIDISMVSGAVIDKQEKTYNIDRIKSNFAAMRS